MTGHVPFIVLVLLGGSDGNPVAPHQSQLDVNHKKPLQTFRPYNIAHRGSNGEIPEETAAAYLVTIDLVLNYQHPNISQSFYIKIYFQVAHETRLYLVLTLLVYSIISIYD
jgi:hypothetical protein